MKQYLQYHKAWERGNPLLFSHPKAFTDDIPQKQRHAFDALDTRARVWLIYRESDKSEDYFLAYTFNAKDFELDGGKIVLYGEPGEAEVFIPPVALNRKAHPWFASLLRRHGNFAFGFMPLNDDGIENLEAIRATSFKDFR
jgi:hypothetical protein